MLKMGRYDFSCLALCTLAVVLQVGIVISADEDAANATSSAVSDASPAVSDATPPSNETTEFSINVKYNESSTNSIRVMWNVPEKNDVHHYYVQSRNLDRSDIIRSPSLENTRRHYVIHDLVRNSKYEVCIYAHFDNDTHIKKCSEKPMATIALIRDDSLIAVFVAVGYICLMILIGYLVYRYHKKRVEDKLLESEEGSRSEEHEEGEKLNPNSAPREYLGPPSSDVPRSSIEDQDIPYITPPVEQLSDDEKDQLRKSTVV